MRYLSFNAAKRFWLDHPLAKRVCYVFLVIVFIAAIAISMYVSQTPKSFNVTMVTKDYINQHKLKDVPGMTSAITLHYTVEVLLTKPGGYLRNDVLPPFVFLDNIPSWEYGVLRQIRDFSSAFREDFSRSQTQSNEVHELTQAQSLYNTTDNSWAFPPTESKYREANKYIANYITILSEGQRTNFHARADNLNNWLGRASNQLGSLSQRLSASISTKRVDLDNENPDSPEIYTKTKWLLLDNVFFEARGHAWALTHYLKAIEVDFSEVLKKKNATKSLKQIIKELEEAQAPLRSPMILNGSGYGILANHSLTMANYISRANAGIIELRNLLKQG